MAGKSKSSESNENSDTSEVAETPESESKTDAAIPESSEDAPVVIEAVAEDVTDEFAEASEDSDPESFQSDQATSESAPAPAAEVTAPVEETTSSGAPVLALIFGGLVAGAIGYFGATLAPDPTFDASELTSGIAANAEVLETLSTDVTALKNAPEPELPDIDGMLAGINQSVDGLASDVAGLQTGLEEVRAGLDEAQAEIEQRAIDLDARILALETAVPAATELSTDDELAALRARISEMTEDAQTRLAEARGQAEEISKAAEEARLAAEAEAAEAKAAAEAREAELQATAKRQEALIDLKAAVESGANYDDLIGNLENVPEVLIAHAETGVPTVGDLRSGFPDVARAALSQANIVPENASASERVTAFFKRRTNARSLTPQEGDGPDAVLSRAEASLADGDLPTALLELEGLPDSSKAALSSWLESANVRMSAIAAIDQLFATN